MQFRFTAQIVATTILVVIALAIAEAKAVGLINGGFEDPVIGIPNVTIHATIPGWQTTDPMGFEIWSNGANGIPPYDGNQFLEITTTGFSPVTLFQDVAGVGLGSLVGFEFAHRAREVVDTMNLTITDLGIDDVAGGGNDIVLFTKNYADGTAAWGFYTSASELPILALGNTMRFAYSSVATGLNHDGNWLDATSISAVNPLIPEPASAMLLLIGAAGWSAAAIRRRRRSE
jgi:hypothetical protein